MEFFSDQEQRLAFEAIRKRKESDDPNTEPMKKCWQEASDSLFFSKQREQAFSTMLRCL